MAQKETEPDMLQRQRAKGAKGWESWGWGTVPNALLKLLVKDKPLYSGKVRETKPPRREKHYSREAPTNANGWQLNPPRIEIRVLKYKVQRTTAYAATTPTVPFKAKMSYQQLHWTRQHAQLVEKDFLAPFHPKPNGCLRFDLESCNLMCTYTVVTHPCDIPPLAQARPMMLCIYTSYYDMSCNFMSWHEAQFWNFNITAWKSHKWLI